MKKLVLFFFLFNIFLPQSLSSQEVKDKITFSKNNLYGTVGSVVLINNFNASYEHLLAKSDAKFIKAYYAKTSAGYVISTSVGGLGGGGDTDYGTLYQIGAVGLTGANKNHFEIGLGVHYASKSIRPSFDPILPTFNLGFRHQKNKGVMYRTGTGYPELFYFGMGVSF